MKKTKLMVLLVVCLIVFSGVAFAEGVSKRYLVNSDSKALKAMFGVQHKFKNGFTTDLSKGELNFLEKFGVEVTEIALYNILKKPDNVPLGKPVCGDGICQGNEQRTCPADCGQQPDPEPEQRVCEPTTQMPYGVIMLNGGTGGAGVNVAVLDTGVYKEHLDLDVQMCMDSTKRGVKKGCTDSNGHGTHVAGTVAANSGADGLGIYGVAPEANLWAIKVCMPDGSCWSDDIAEGIRYAADKGANVISMSLGGNSESLLIKDAVDYAAGKGVLVVGAAGNDGPAEGTIDWPGANANVIAVGAIDSGEQVAEFSSRGVNDGDYVVEDREVEFGAPGVNVLSTYKNGCYATGSGTSMATPHMSGLAAKLWQGSADATRTYLQELAKNHDLHTLGDDSATGFGLPVAP